MEGPGESGRGSDDQRKKDLNDVNDSAIQRREGEGVERREWKWIRSQEKKRHPNLNLKVWNRNWGAQHTDILHITLDLAPA